MKVLVNGKEECLSDIGTVRDLILLKNLPDQRLVIEVNGKLVKHEQWEQTTLQEDDRIEILRFMGGG